MNGCRARAVSPVIGVILMVAITVILAAVVGTLAFGIADRSGGAGPSVTLSADEFDAETGTGDDQLVRLTHEGGATVEASALELVVTLEATGARSRIVDLPVSSNKLDDSNVRGDDIFDTRSGEARGAISTSSPDTDGELSAGDFLQVRIKEGDDGYPVQPGDEVTVRVVHTGSDTVLTEQTLTAT